MFSELLHASSNLLALLNDAILRKAANVKVVVVSIEFRLNFSYFGHDLEIHPSDYYQDEIAKYYKMRYFHKECNFGELHRRVYFHLSYR